MRALSNLVYLNDEVRLQVGKRSSSLVVSVLKSFFENVDVFMMVSQINCRGEARGSRESCSPHGLTGRGGVLRPVCGRPCALWATCRCVMPTCR